MRNCDNCNNGSYGLDCSTGVETLYCRETDYEYEVSPTDVCSSHEYIDGLEKDNVLGYDCDGRAIDEFRILRFPFSADIEDWDSEPNVDPRFYCLVRSSSGEVFAMSVYDDWSCEQIRRYEKLDKEVPVTTLLKTVEEMSYYEVAFDGITEREWYYDRNRDELKKELERTLKEQRGFSKKLTSK